MELLLLLLLRVLMAGDWGPLLELLFEVVATVGGVDVADAVAVMCDLEIVKHWRDTHSYGELGFDSNTNADIVLFCNAEVCECVCVCV